MMSHKAMKERHWKRISDVTKHPLDIQSIETFTLRVLMQAPLLKNKEDIEVHHAIFYSFIEEMYLKNYLNVNNVLLFSLSFIINFVNYDLVKINLYSILLGHLYISSERTRY